MMVRIILRTRCLLCARVAPLDGLPVCPKLCAEGVLLCGLGERTLDEDACELRVLRDAGAKL